MNAQEQYRSADPWIQQLIRKMQQAEIDGYYAYLKLANRVKDPTNKELLTRIANDEMNHYRNWKRYTGKDLKPRKWKIALINTVSRLMGFTFAVKKMQIDEELGSREYQRLTDAFPETQQIVDDEERHEKELLELLDEERLRYVGSMVLGLNDALVELTGTIAGLTFALQSTRLVALSGLITGISATLSMASSEYLSARSDGDEHALKSCTYTGIAYLITVVLLVLPYLLYPDKAYAWALGTMLVIVILIILFFNYYIAVAKSLPFKKRFLEMAGISLSVALISFIIGLLVKQFLGVDV